jgi:electron transfer flavoprotein beta subunit
MRGVLRMNIVVFLKQVPDPKGFIRIKKDGTIDRENSKSIINPYDKNALEAALQVRERYGAKITVITMGPAKASDALREALALGADEAILLSDRCLAGSDTLASSYALSMAVRKLESYDLILCGMEASDGNTAQVGPEIAERLGIPQLTYVDKFEVIGDFVEARRMIEGGYERLRVRLPALLTVTNTANVPRDTRFSGIIGAMKKDVSTWSASYIEANMSKLGWTGSPTKIKKIERSVTKRDRWLIKNETADAVDTLMNKLKEDGVELGERHGKNT